MTVRDRLLDLIVLALLGPVILLGVAIGTGLVLLREGRPIFYTSQRMKTVDQEFTLWKFRTMAASDENSGVTGGDKANRVTDVGRFLRRTRLDELPQAWNVLRGDIRLVGPRPPLPEYVARFPEIYSDVLKSRPGITGLATLRYKDTEARLLSQCKTPSETDAVYTRRCLPRKAALDLIYQRNKSTCFDLNLMRITFGGLLKRGTKKA